MGLLLMTRFTLLEAVRRKIFLAVLILSIVLVGAFAILLSIAIDFLVANNGSGLAPQLYLLGTGIFITILTIWMVYLLSSLLTVVMSSGMISGEIEAGTFALIVPKPIRRVEIVLGKWLGYAIILCGYTAFLFLAFLAIIYWKTGYWPPRFLYALGTLELCMLSLLGITTIGSAFVPTIVTGAIALVLFIGAPIANFVQFVVQIATPDQSQSMQNIGTIIGLIIPTDTLWRGTSYFLIPPPDVFVTLGISLRTFDSPITSLEPIATAFVIWVVLYSIVLPLVAVWRFQRRDL